MRSMTPSSISSRSTRLGGRRVAVAHAQALVDELAQVVALAARRRACRSAGSAACPSSIVDVAALGDLERGGERLGPLGERLRHLLRVDFR